jgi:hypothetical protein
MCASCGWEQALKIMDDLRAWRLASICGWVEEHHCIADRQWRAIITVAGKMNQPIEPGELPDHLREPDIEYLRSLPEFVDEGENLPLV